MTLPAIDQNGILRHVRGPGGGQFAPRPTSPPTSPLDSDTERLQAKVRVKWRELLNDLVSEQPPSARPKIPAVREARSTTAHSVTIPAVRSQQAPVAVIVGRVGATEGVTYRRLDARLFRQVFAPVDSRGVSILGREATTSAAAGTSSPRDEARGSDTSGPRRHVGTGATSTPVRLTPVPAPTVRIPIPADAAWFQAEAERTPVKGTDEASALAAVQGHFDRFAAIDGEVWRESDPPVYRVTDPSISGSIGLAVVAAPDPATDFAPAEEHFAPDEYDEAVAALQQRAAAIGARAEPVPAEPPIEVMGELPTPSWREPIRPTDQDHLTVANFRDGLAAFREEIVMVPGAVTGDVGAYLAVGAWRIDFSALTAKQQERYRRFALFGANHGLI